MMPGYYIRETNLLSRVVTYREYASKSSAKRAYSHLTRQAAHKGIAVSYTLIEIDASGAETCLEVW